MTNSMNKTASGLVMATTATAIKVSTDLTNITEPILTAQATCNVPGTQSAFPPYIPSTSYDDVLCQTFSCTNDPDTDCEASTNVWTQGGSGLNGCLGQGFCTSNLDWALEGPNERGVPRAPYDGQDGRFNVEQFEFWNTLNTGIAGSFLDDDGVCRAICPDGGAECMGRLAPGATEQGDCVLDNVIPDVFCGELDFTKIFPNFVKSFGGLDFQNFAVTKLVLPELTAYSPVTISNNPRLQELDLSKTKLVVGGLKIDNNPQLTSLNLDGLEQTQSLKITGSPNLTGALHLPNLEKFVTGFSGAHGLALDGTGLSEVSAPVLAAFENSAFNSGAQTAVSIKNNPHLSALNFDSNCKTQGVIDIANNPMLASASMPVLEELECFFFPEDPRTKGCDCINWVDNSPASGSSPWAVDSIACPTPAPTAAPTSSPTRPAGRACQGDRAIWDAGYGKCNTYASPTQNGNYCNDADCNNFDSCISANDACFECGECE